MTDRAIRWLAVGAAAASLVIAVVTAVLFVLEGSFGGDPLSNVLALVAVACYAVVGGLVALRLPRNACGWLLLVIGLGLVVSMGTDVGSTLAERAERTGLATWTLWLNSWLLIPTAWLGITSYLLVFPTGALPSRRWSPFVAGLLVISVVGVVARMVQPWDGQQLTNPLARGGSLPGIVFGIVSLAFTAALIAAVVSIVLRFRRAAPTERLALRWLAVVGVVAGVLLVTAIAAGALGLDRVGDPFGVAFLLVLVVGLPASASAALLMHRIDGVEVVANRSVVYGSLVAVITVIYAIVVAGVGAVVGRSERSDVFAAVAATAVAAVVFQPARRRAQRFADRLIYGDRASPYELVATFTERLDDASLGEVLPRMTVLIAEGTGAERVRIWLRADGALRPVAAWPAETAMPIPVAIDGTELARLGDTAFPVRHGGETLGAISVGLPPQEPMTPATERLLTDLSTQAGLVVRNVALVQELQRSRQRLVTSQDEARRRLERDLHDGAQQRLVTLSMDLRIARERAGSTGDVALASQLDTAEDELRRSLAELRELAHGIHPAILSQNGVGAAVRSLADRSPVPVELGTVPDGRFPPEVEATAYFVVSEALANVAKHAGASRVRIDLEDTGDRLTIDIRDDGIGGATLQRGSGLRGLADRVEAVGGRIDVRSEIGAGSTVHAEIPCASR
jgi:signal transduction histidine kinase